MIPSTVAIMQDNSIHGEDTFLTRDLGNNAFLDAVMDGVTAHGGEEASRSVKEALEAIPVNSPEDVVAALEDINDEFYQVGGGRFLLTTVSTALYLANRLYVIGAGDSPIFLVKPDSVDQICGRTGRFFHVGVASTVGAGPSLSNLTRLETNIEPGFRLILATDGLSDNILTPHLAEIVRGAESPEDASQQTNSTVEYFLQSGRVPEELGRRFRRDDRTGIFRFFTTPT
jgi:serine/threonine protein phosphatase PrpC